MESADGGASSAAPVLARCTGGIRGGLFACSGQEAGSALHLGTRVRPGGATLAGRRTGKGVPGAMDDPAGALATAASWIDGGSGGAAVHGDCGVGDRSGGCR